MFISRFAFQAVGVLCLTLLVFASAALAAGPATVTVRVEGLTETKLPLTQVTTTTEPVVKDGKPEDSCSGTSALGALQLATGGNWSGPWETAFKEYVIYSIEGESHPFGTGYFWDFWLNHNESKVGACGAQLENGEEVLLFPCSEAALECPNPLEITAPENANVGEKISVAVRRYKPTGEALAVSGASVTGGGASATTGPGGNATLTFSAPGEYMLVASLPETVRAETSICVQAGASGVCGPRTSPSSQASLGSSTASGSGSAGVLSSSSSSYTGPYAVVAKALDLIDGHVYKRGHAPRVLDGTVLAHRTIASVSLRLRREYRGRCYAYSGTREEFGRVRCGQGSYFKVSTAPSFSYLLPSALAPGRYVLDIEATDIAGNSTTLARGTSRIVFYVD